MDRILRIFFHKFSLAVFLVILFISHAHSFERIGIIFPRSTYRSTNKAIICYKFDRSKPRLFDICIRARIFDKASGKLLKTYFYNNNGRAVYKKCFFREAWYSRFGDCWLGYLSILETGDYNPQEVEFEVFWFRSGKFGKEEFKGELTASPYLEYYGKTSCVVADLGRMRGSFEFVRSVYTKPGIHIMARVSKNNMRLNFELGGEIAKTFFTNKERRKSRKLIFIHGLGCDASMWFKGKADKSIVNNCMPKDLLAGYWPLISQYDEIAFFEYPSMQGVASKNVGRALAKVFFHCSPEDRVDIIAHSMGGIVARYYIEKLGGSRFVDNLVLVQVPNQGIINKKLGQVRNGMRSVISTLSKTGIVGSFEKMVPASQLFADSKLMKSLNASWEKGQKPTSQNGFANTKYFAIATGIYGSGYDVNNVEGWFDDLPNFNNGGGNEIRAVNALYLPLGDGKIGTLDSTGKHELLVISSGKDHDRYIKHAQMVFYAGNDNLTGVGRWILSRLWGE
jgi:pimeloyl-ACP methyl ester carboxylesterase